MPLTRHLSLSPPCFVQSVVPAYVSITGRGGGVLVPVAKDQHGETIDGHNREAIADELGIDYQTIVHHCDSDEERLEIARTLNADRRQLTEEQRRDIVGDLRAEGHSLRAIGGAVGVSQTQVARDIETAVTDVTPERVTGSDGKSYPSSRPKAEPENSDAVTTQVATGETPQEETDRVVSGFYENRPEAQERLEHQKYLNRCSAAICDMTDILDWDAEEVAEATSGDRTVASVFVGVRQWMARYEAYLEKGLRVVKGGSE